MKFRFIYLVALLIMSTIPCGTVEASHNVIRGMNASGQDCADGHSSHLIYTPEGGCHWNPLVGDRGSAELLWGAGQKFVPTSDSRNVGSVFGWEAAYVPFSANYKIRMYFCPSIYPVVCPKSSATYFMDTVRSVFIRSGQLIYEQNVDFGGYSGMLSSSSNACLVLLDDHMNEWRSAGMFFCKGVMELPNTGSTCFLNHGTDISVDMGILERSEIQTSIASSKQHQKRDVSVLCTRDAGTAVTIQFEYVSLSVDDGDSIKTNANGVGVAMVFDGERVERNKIISRDYEPGYTMSTLEFYAVRESTQPLSDIPTGDFKASAVMIMTIQ